MKTVDTLADACSELSKLTENMEVVPRNEAPCTGYSLDEINRIQEQLGVIFHPTITLVFRNIKPDGLSFGSIRLIKFMQLGVLIKDRKLPGLKSTNELFHPNKRIDIANLLVVGISDGYLVLVDNYSGEIYTIEEHTFETWKVAADLSEFIKLAATIMVNTANSADTSEAPDEEIITTANEIMDTMRATNEKKFWHMLASGVI